jgi:uncharacterized protein (DUF433 family)
MAKERKGEPFSIRLTLATQELVEHEARRTKRSKGAIVEALAEEAARMRRFPGIAFRGDDAAREPWVVGTGLDVWEIVQMLDDFGSAERLCAETHLQPQHVRLASAYYASYPEEIDAAVAENRLPAEELRRLYPFVVTTDAPTP